MPQYLLLREAAARKHEREMLFAASMTANVMNSTGMLKRPVTARKLLGWPEVERTRHSPAEQERLLDKALRKVLVKGKRCRKKA